MKTFRTKLKSSLFLVTLMLSVSALAKPVGQVTEVTGQVFAVTPEGKTKALKVNDHLEEKSDVMVEEGASITLNDYYNATYHMIGGTHLKFFDKSVQLKKGKAWVQSQNSRHSLALTTANGNIDFFKVEFIATFDQTTSRSQVLVVNGDAEVSNILDKNMKHTVTAGTFTLIDPEVESGSPRTPTKVGLTSLNEALGEFKQLPKSLIVESPARTIASVPETNVKKGEIIFISSNRMPASVQSSAHNYYKRKASKTVSIPVPVKFYGVTPAVAGTQKPAIEAQKQVGEDRTPASTSTLLAPKASDNIHNDAEFSASLKKEIDQQPKYPKELSNLIEDLKSY